MSFQNKEERLEACAARGARSASDWPGLRGLASCGAKMEGSLRGGGGPPAHGEQLLSSLQETLDVLSPQELRKFRAILPKVDEEPRVTPLKLELEGGSPGGLARLLAKHYHPWVAPRVLIKILRQLPRTDLLPRWQSYPADGLGERGAGPGWDPPPPGVPRGPSAPRAGRGGGVSEPAGGREHRGANGTSSGQVGGGGGRSGGARAGQAPFPGWESPCPVEEWPAGSARAR